MFSDRDLKDVHPHDDALVINIRITNAMVNQMLIYHGSGVKIIFEKVAEMMKILDSINQNTITLHMFKGTQVWSVKTVNLAVEGEPYNILVYFHIMDYLTSHKAILGRN